MGVLSILLLQLIWLINAYKMTKIDIIQKSDDLLNKAIERESLFRLTKMIVPGGEIVGSSPIDATMDNTMDKLQESLFKLGSEMSLSDVDSIYRVLLNKANINTETILFSLDSANNVIKSTMPSNRVYNTFKFWKTTIIPIYSNHSLNIQGIIVNPYWMILKRMGLILLATVIIMIFICWCIVYQIKVIINERRIAKWKDTFSRAMIHDMKTPIAGIRLSIHILKDIKPEEENERNEMLNYIEKENEHLYALANKVLTIAKMEGKKIVIKKQVFKLSPVVEDLIERFEKRTTKQIDFKVNLAVDEAFGEEEYIKEAIYNLIDNAIKYSGESVKITICSKMENEMLCISVEDNGIGISRSDRNRIFEKFERGARTLKNGISGFGLGLNYVKHVAEAHGGRADMMSREGYGSVFMIIIPNKTDD